MTLTTRSIRRWLERIVGVVAERMPRRCQASSMELLAPSTIADALATVTDHWTPKVTGRVNDQYIKVAKLLGELVWHAHDEEDEMFLVVYGHLRIQLEGDREVALDPGQFFVVPKGVQHNPVAEEEVGIVLIETVTTAHTGSVQTERTVPIERQL
jgi:mannose-6-phosphate isomerase-like protein (cupin superfamily)